MLMDGNSTGELPPRLQPVENPFVLESSASRYDLQLMGIAVLWRNKRCKVDGQVADGASPLRVKPVPSHHHLWVRLRVLDGFKKIGRRTRKRAENGTLSPLNDDERNRVRERDLC